MPRITVEHSARVYDDDHGWFVEVTPDRDGLGMARIAYNEGDGTEDSKREISLPWFHAEALAHAILAIAPKNKEDQP